ncbi:hypothetical protein HA402_011243 [Bradysia odoriphaga]|nr:hypothetical protein HA402_011243 [Bradysia odoriphaga]
MLDAVDDEVHLAHPARGIEGILGAVPGIRHLRGDLVDVRPGPVPCFSIGDRDVGEDRVVVAVLTSGDVVRRDALAGEGGGCSAHGAPSWHQVSHLSILSATSPVWVQQTRLHVRHFPERKSDEREVSLAGRSGEGSAQAAGDLGERHRFGEHRDHDVVRRARRRLRRHPVAAAHIGEGGLQRRQRHLLRSAQQLAQHVVVHGRDEGGEPDGIQRIDPRKRAAKIVVEQALVAEHGDDLAFAQHGHLADDLVATARELGVTGEVAEHGFGCCAHGAPGVVVPVREELAQLLEQHLVIGEDHVLFAAELAEEGRAGDAGGLRDLLDGGLVEPLRLEQFERGGDDGGARRCGFVHDESLDRRRPAVTDRFGGWTSQGLPQPSEGTTVDLYEYQARDVFEKYGVPVLAGIVADTPEEVKAAAEKIGGVVVVKAQVKTGGRGKAGGVKVAKTPDEAYEAAKAILGLDIKGHIVKRVMVAQGAGIAEEFYFSVLLDRANRSYLSLCSVEGGMEIEQLAVEKPEALARVEVNPLTGIDKEKAVEIARAANFPEDLVEKVSDVFVKLFDVYKGEDATLVEVNPLVRTEDGDIIALDGKVTLDDNASEIRHPEHEELEDKDAADPLEAKAKENGLNYVKLDGEVGIIGNGAGLVMSTLDVVAYAGENHGGVKPANFLDIGGGASAEVMASGLDVILGDPQVKSVFVNVFGGITACDAVANGIKGALETLGATASKPLVVRLDGNRVEEGRAILAEYAHPLVTLAATMDEGADKAAELANA